MIRYSKFVFMIMTVPAVLAAQPTAAKPKTPVDWDAMRTAAVGVLRQYFRINTTNPPGNELEAARFLKTHGKLGIIAYDLDPFRVEAADEQNGVHSNDDRLSLANIGAGVKFVYDILRYAQ